jgi:AraC-like DNA-binding protein
MIVNTYDMNFSNGNDAAVGWSDMLLKNYGLHCECDALEFTGSLTKRSMMGHVEVSRVQFHALTLSPTDENGLSQLRESIFIKLVDAGNVTIEQAGQRRCFEDGSMFALDPERRFTESIPEHVQMVIVRIPKVRLRERGLPHSLRGVFTCNMGSPDLIAARQLISCIANQPDALSPKMRISLGELLLDLMDTILKDQSNSTKWRSAAATLMRAKSYVARHLGDDELDAVAIATATHVSVKHLQRLFNRDGVSMMRYVWQARLERAESLLRASTLPSMPVHEVSYRCGFRSPVHFSRAFKQRYGVSPRDMVHISIPPEVSDSNE